MIPIVFGERKARDREYFLARNPKLQDSWFLLNPRETVKVFLVFMLLADQKIIVDKASELFKQYGIKSTSMDDIAGQLGMSKKTLYQIIADKNKLIEIVLTEEYHYFKSQLDVIEKINQDGIFQYIELNHVLNEFLLNISLPVMFDLKKYQSATFEHFEELYTTLFYNKIKSNLEKGISEKLFREDININIISKLLLSRIERVSSSIAFKWNEFSSPEFVKEICIYHLRGIVTEEGMKLVEKYKNKIEKIYKTEAV